MPNTMLNVQRPFSKLHYAKVNNLDPRRLLLNAPNLFSDFYYRLHEFDGALIAGDWSTDVTGAGSPVAFAYNAQRNGGLQGSTGATDNNVTALFQPNVAFDSADYPTVFLRWRAPADPTGMAFEIGWSDAKTDEKLVCVSALTGAAAPTITNGITDFGLLVMNTDLTLTTTAIIGDGTTGAVNGALVGTWAPTASKLIDMIIGISPNGTRAQIWDNGAFVGDFSASNGPDSGTLVRFSAIWKSLDAAAKVINIQKIAFLAEENAA